MINTTYILVLGYTFYTIVTTTILSLLLGVRLLLRRIFPFPASEKIGNVIALYEGTIYHGRRVPAHNTFRMTARYALIDLDLPPYSPPGFLTANHVRRNAKTKGPVYLLTIPPSVGYDHCPVSFYYCYDIEGDTKTLKRCLVEATNTPWSESVTYVFDPNSDMVPKPQHISPFMDMRGNWKLKVSEPGENLYAFASQPHPELGTFFRASYTAKRVATSSTGFSADHLHAFFWLIPHRVTITTYLAAMRLWWKNVPFYDHPRKENPSYRDEVYPRDQMMQLCPIFGGNDKSREKLRKERIARSFIWKDAKKPWSYLIESAGKKM